MRKMKQLLSGIIMLLLICTMNITVFAGQWKHDGRGWWYQNDDGSYPAGTWQWIDSNGDGVSECYYFYWDGYMAYNNDVDGYYLNDDGQWTVGGTVQKKATGVDYRRTQQTSGLTAEEAVLIAYNAMGDGGGQVNSIAYLDRQKDLIYDYDDRGDCYYVKFRDAEWMRQGGSGTIYWAYVDKATKRVHH